MLDATGCQNFLDGVSGRILTRLFFNGCLAVDDANPVSFSTSVYIDAADSTATIRQKMLDAIKASVLADFSVVIENGDILLPTYSTGLSTPASETRTDSFTATGNGQTIDTSLRPLSSFSLNVKGVGGSPTAWTVYLEGSLNGVDFTKILEHNQILGVGQGIFSGANRSPSLFVRSRVVSLTLLPASAIDVTILGVP